MYVEIYTYIDRCVDRYVYNIHHFVYLGLLRRTCNGVVRAVRTAREGLRCSRVDASHRARHQSPPMKHHCSGMSFTNHLILGFKLVSCERANH